LELWTKEQGKEGRRTKRQDKRAEFLPKKSERGKGNTPPTPRKKMVFGLGGTTGGAIYYPTPLIV